MLSSEVMIQSTFGALGLLIEEKSIQSPVQRIEFIRMVLDATEAKVVLPQARFQMMLAISLDPKAYPTITVRNCLIFLGHMASCTYMFPQATSSQEASGMVGLDVLPSSSSSGHGGLGAHSNLSLSGLIDIPIQCVCGFRLPFLNLL